MNKVWIRETFKKHEEMVDAIKEHIIKYGVKPISCYEFEDLISYVKNHIYKDIKKNGLLQKEFHRRANYYPDLYNSKEFKELINKLITNVKDLYALINLDVAIYLEDSLFGEDDRLLFYSNCNKAIQNLKVEFDTFSFTNKSAYIQLLELIQSENNYHNLNFELTCHFIKGIPNAIFDYDNLTINNTIGQYESLEYLINDFLIETYSDLITDKNKFNTIMQEYRANIRTLKNKLKDEPEGEKSYEFYLFDKMMNCDPSKWDHQYNFIEINCRCLDCIRSISTVVSQLRDFIEYSSFPIVTKII